MNSPKGELSNSKLKLHRYPSSLKALIILNQASRESWKFQAWNSHQYGSGEFFRGPGTYSHRTIYTLYVCERSPDVQRSVTPVLAYTFHPLGPRFWHAPFFHAPAASYVGVSRSYPHHWRWCFLASRSLRLTLEFLG